jgi:hypothetical protein
MALDEHLLSFARMLVLDQIDELFIGALPEALLQNCHASGPPAATKRS